MADNQLRFYACRYCGASFFDKGVFMKHVNQHEVTLAILEEQFSTEIGNLILRYADNVQDPMVRMKLVTIMRYLMTGAVSRQQLEAAGLGRFFPLLQHRKDRIVREFFPVLENFVELDPDLTVRALEGVDPDQLLPDARKLLEERGFLAQKLNYIA